MRCATAMESRKRLAPHTVLQLCDSENAETLQIYYSASAAVVVFLHRRAMSSRIGRSRGDSAGVAPRFGRFV